MTVATSRPAEPQTPPARERTRAGEPRVIEIAPTPGWRSVDLPELWAFRELLWILVWRDLKVRYRQTLLGAVWVLGQPLLTMLIFTFLFNRVARFDAPGGLPYPVFVMAGLLPWTFFSNGVQASGNSLIGSSHLISKIYFPRLIVPTAAVLVGLADLGVSCLLLAGMMAWYAVAPTAMLLLMPVVLLLAFVLAEGVGLWLSALNVEYRDVRVIIPFVLQLCMYATPVVYPLHVLPERFRKLAVFNPATGIVEGFRSAALGTAPPWTALGFSAIGAVVVLVSGVLYFRRMERLFADVL